MGQWNLIVQGLATKKSGSTVSTGLTMERNDIYTRDNLNSVITDSGGNGFGTDPYWTSSEYYYGVAWIMVFNLGCASKSYKTNKWPVRSVFAF